MNGTSSLLRSALMGLMALAVAGAITLPAQTASAASRIKVVVNNTAITTGNSITTNELRSTVHGTIEVCFFSNFFTSFLGDLIVDQSRV